MTQGEDSEAAAVEREARRILAAADRRGRQGLQRRAAAEADAFVEATIAEDATRRAEAARDALAGYLSGGNWPPGGGPVAPLDREVAAFLSGILADAISGRTPAALVPLLRKGNRASPARQTAMDVAVIYIRAARLGVVDDKRPVQTIAELYGAGVDTVRGWLARSRIGDEQVAAFRPNDPAELRAVRLADAARIEGAKYDRLRRDG